MDFTNGTALLHCIDGIFKMPKLENIQLFRFEGKPNWVQLNTVECSPTQSLNVFQLCCFCDCISKGRCELGRHEKKRRLTNPEAGERGSESVSKSHIFPAAPQYFSSASGLWSSRRKIVDSPWNQSNLVNGITKILLNNWPHLLKYAAYLKHFHELMLLGAPLFENHSAIMKLNML